MNEYVAFLDEWGNNGLDFTKQGVSTHFIVVAITLRKEQLAEAELQLEAIRSRFFQTGPIKSAKVGSDDVIVLAIGDFIIFVCQFPAAAFLPADICVSDSRHLHCWLATDERRPARGDFNRSQIHFDSNN